MRFEERKKICRLDLLVSFGLFVVFSWFVGVVGGEKFS